MSMSKLLTTHNIIEYIDNSYRNKLKNNRYVCLCSLSNSVAATIIRRNGHLALSALLHNKDIHHVEALASCYCRAMQLLN